MIYGHVVTFAISGGCGLGAVEVARIRGVWAVGAVEDGVQLRSHVLVATYKDWIAGAKFGIEQLVKGSLPMG